MSFHSSNNNIKIYKKRWKAGKNGVHRSWRWINHHFEYIYIRLLFLNWRSCGIYVEYFQSIWFPRCTEWRPYTALCRYEHKSLFQVNTHYYWIEISHRTVFTDTTRMFFWTWTFWTIRRTLLVRRLSIEM